MSGLKSYHAGLAAEAQVAKFYERRGHTIAARRWRGAGGEIDLIARNGAQVIFIEVKQSRTHDMAAQHLSARQIARLYSAAAEFVENEPLGQLTEVRLDAALVDGTGQIEILQNFAA
ncbi:MAG: YraN family protein [Cypionkella sp.]